MNYLLANKEWIFSGIGVLILTALWNFFYRKRSADTAREPILTNSNTNTNNINLFTSEAQVNHKFSDGGKPALAPTSSEKTQVRILFVDDDTRFKVVNILTRAGWIYTKNKVDVENLEDPDVVEANIIFVDINGVGASLFKDEGLGLAVALKTKYRNKKIVIYSAEQHGNRFHPALRQVDAVLPKNAEPYEFINLLETFSKELLSR